MPWAMTLLARLAVSVFSAIVLAPIAVSIWESSLDADPSSVKLAFGIGIGVALFLAMTKDAWNSERRGPDISQQLAELDAAIAKAVQDRSVSQLNRLLKNLLPTGAAALSIGVAPRVGLVADRTRTSPGVHDTPTDVLSAYTGAAERLLLLGRPGSGKSVAAYQIAGRLIADGQKLLVVNLSSWDNQHRFDRFLADHLSARSGYNVQNAALARTWVDRGDFSLILDGLDEITGRRAQAACIAALNNYIARMAPTQSLVLTCRTTDYDALAPSLPDMPTLVLAYELEPLSDDQVATICEHQTLTDSSWQWILDNKTGAAHTVWQTLRLPLMASLAAEGALGPQLAQPHGATEDAIIDGYLDATAQQHPTFSPTQLTSWFRWIARYIGNTQTSPMGMSTADSVVFEPASLTPPTPPGRYRFIVGIALALVVGLFVGLEFALDATEGDRLFAWLSAGLVFGSVAGLSVVMFASAQPPTQHMEQRSSRELWALLIVGTTCVWLLADEVGIWVVGLCVAAAAVIALNNGGWFLMLQARTRRALRQAGGPHHPSELLQWGVETGLLRPTGNGFRFRHDRIARRLTAQPLVDLSTPRSALRQRFDEARAEVIADQ